MSRFWIIFIVILSVIIVLEVFIISRYYYARMVGRVVFPGNMPVTINLNGSKSILIPEAVISENLKNEIKSVTKNENREYVTGENGIKRLVSVSGQLLSAQLQNPGVLTVEVVHEGVPIHFLEVLSDVGLIDNRNGQFRPLKISDFLATRPDPPSTVTCSILAQGSPSEFKCGMLLLQNSPHQ